MCFVRTVLVMHTPALVIPFKTCPVAILKESESRYLRSNALLACQVVKGHGTHFQDICILSSRNCVADSKLRWGAASHPVVVTCPADPPEERRNGGSDRLILTVPGEPICHARRVWRATRSFSCFSFRIFQGPEGPRNHPF